VPEQPPRSVVGVIAGPDTPPGPSHCAVAAGAEAPPAPPLIAGGAPLHCKSTTGAAGGARFATLIDPAAHEDHVGGNEHERLRSGG
jgi:hypothetical protein